jgi:hypothetical protein
MCRFPFPEAFLWPTPAEVIISKVTICSHLVCLEVRPCCLSPIPVRQATPDGCILFDCIVVHSWYSTWLVPRYAAYFQFITDDNEQYAILNIHSASEISSVKMVVRREVKWREERIQETWQSLSIKAVSHAINIFAVRAHPRRPHVTGTLSRAQIQTTTYSPELWWAVQMRTTATWTLVTMPSTTKLPPITTQASKQLSPLS